MRAVRSTRLGIPATLACPHAADGWSLSCAPDTCVAAFCVMERIDLIDSNSIWDGEDDELCDVIPFGDGLHVASGVVQGQHDFAPIPCVDDAGAVAEHEVLFDAGAAADEHHADMPAWDCYVDTCVAETVLSCWDYRRMIQRQVSASVICVGAARRVSVLVE